MPQKTTHYTCLESACGTATDGRILLIAICHRMPDPIADLTSYVIDLEIDSTPPKYSVEINGGRAMFPLYPSVFSCIARDPAGTVFVGEDDGFIRYRDGRSEVVKHGPKIGITNCCYVRDVDNIVFGTSGGNIVHSHGERLEVIPIASPARRKAGESNVQAIHGIGSDFMVAVGECGLVSNYREGKWERIKPPSNTRFFSVWCRSKREIYVGGRRGQIWRWDGDSRWQKLKLDFKPEPMIFDFSDLIEYEGVLYAACDDQGIYRLEGDQWVSVPKVQDESVGKLAVTSSGLIGLGALWGNSGSWFTHFDGKAWTTKQIHIPPV